MSILEQLTNKVKSICSRGTSSPIEIAQVQMELENEVLQLKLGVSKKIKERALRYQTSFRQARWEGDLTMSYNEASAAAKADMAKIDEEIANLKAYRDYFENLGTILKSYSSSFFRD